MNRITQLPPFKRMCVTIGAVPSSYIDSMSYYETLVWLCKYLKDTVIPAINDNAAAIEELQDLFTQLQEYVDNYFENLDVQEEIDHKLDDMVEAGTLQEIISEYLNSTAVFGFDTVDDMKDATNLIDGSYARTLGYYSVNDGGAGLYKIRTITNEDDVDEGYIIALQDNTLIAELIIENNTINVNQYGLKPNDNTFSNSTKFSNLLDKCNENGNMILFDKGDYYFDEPIVKSSRLQHIHIKGQGYQFTESEKGTALVYTGSGWFLTFDLMWKCTIEDLELQGSSGSYCINCNNTVFYTKFNNLNILDFDRGIRIISSGYFWLNTISVFSGNTTTEYAVSIGGVANKQPEYVFIDGLISEDDSIHENNSGIQLLSGIHIFINHVDLVKKAVGINILPIEFLSFWNITNVDMAQCATGFNLETQSRALINGLIDNIVYTFRTNALSTDRFMVLNRTSNKMISDIDITNIYLNSLDGSLGDYSIEDVSDGTLTRVNIGINYFAYSQKFKLFKYVDNYQPLVKFPEPLKGRFKVFKINAAVNTKTVTLLSNSPFVVSPLVSLTADNKDMIKSYSVSNTNGGNLDLTITFNDNVTGNFFFSWEIVNGDYKQTAVN